MSTPQTLLTSCQYKFGQDSSNIRFQDDFWTSINNAQYDFCTSRAWGFLRTMATLTATHAVRTTALPSDFGSWYDIKGALRIATPAANLGGEVEIMTHEDWLTNEYEDGSEEGEPTCCYILGTSIYWSPIPDATYTVTGTYYKIPASVEDTSSSLTVPTVYGEVLQKMIYRRLQDAGYSSVAELQISDADIQKLLGQYARDDIKKYGGLTMNLSPNAVNRRTI